jgi:hypothetical protein
MNKTKLAVCGLLVSVAACSTSPELPAFARAGEVHFTKANVDEKALLADIGVLVGTPGVALVADYEDGGSAYLTVYVQPGQDLGVREKVLNLGWSRVASIPISAKPVSRVFGRAF